MLIDAPGEYYDRLGRCALVTGRATHNPDLWDGTAGDGGLACWRADGVMESSLPSSIDLVSKARPLAARLRGALASIIADPDCCEASKDIARAALAGADRKAGEVLGHG